MQVKVRDKNVMKAYKKLKKMLHNEGVVKELQERRHYTKPSDAKRKKRKDAIRRQQKEDAKRTARLFG